MSTRRLGEQFEDLAKQDHAARLAMWVFLAREILLFAALFALYTCYRAMYPDDFARAAAHNQIPTKTGAAAAATSERGNSVPQFDIATISPTWFES